jgi:hypothetical protein
MRSYTFYLYKDDGSLIGSATREAESDEAARTLSLSLFDSYPGCEELEIWETPRYIAQRRRRAAGAVGLSRSRPALRSGPDRPHAGR